jgi:hypothetical protein
MKGKNSNKSPSFVPYDDDKLEHASAGPDYGQPWSSSHAWHETSSKEYPKFVVEIINRLLSNPVKIASTRY